jgi:hypothetical protein
MENIIAEVLFSVRNWESVAEGIGISRTEREQMKSAFNY